jgi:DNA-binding transcriptional LysR family regulator
MPRKIDWESQIGRQLRLRDLHVLFVVAQQGGMAKAAAQLGVSAPTVSEIIADLEHRIGVRLLDRNAKGVEPNVFGQALLKRVLVIFDELKLGIKDIESLADPAVGEIKVASPLAIASTIVPPILERFSREYPGVVVQFDEVTSTDRQFRDLRARRYDLVFERGGHHADNEHQADDDLDYEFLFDDRLVIVAGATSKWASRRRKIDLAELIDEPWIMQARHTWNHRSLAEAFRKRGLPMPPASLVTLSISVIAHLIADGRSISSMPASVAHLKSLKILPVDLPEGGPWPVNIVTLRNRTLGAAARKFIECAREVTCQLDRKFSRSK